MHLSATILCAAIFLNLLAVNFAVAQGTTFDKYFGSFNPPDYIPIDATADGSGNVYVLDIYHDRIRKLDQQGKVLLELPLVAKWLRGIEIDSLGNLYVVDAAGATSGINSDAVIYKLDPQGNQLALWPSSARGIGIDASDRLYTVSEVTGTVSVLNTGGNLLLEFGAGILSKPEDVDATADGAFIYVADSGNARIAKFDAAGNFLLSWGSFGSGDLEFSNPVSLTVDQSGNVFVTDRRNYKIKKFDPNGNLLALTGGQGTGPGLFQEPHGNTVDAFGNLWLATYHGHDVQKFDNNLNYLLTVAGYRSAPGEFADVRGVGVDSERNVFVADKWLQRVTKFDRDGNYLMHFGIRGQGEAAEFNFPRTVHVDVHDNVYVSDDGHVRKFDTDGNYITRYGKYLYIQGLATDATGNLLFAARTSHHKVTRVDQATLSELTFGVRGTGPGEFDQPWGVAVGPNGMLYVADSNNARVQRFTLDGVYDMEWGSFGSQPGQFKKPTGLVIDAAGKVYVGDAQNDNIQVFDPDGNYLYGWGTRGTAPGQFEKIWSLALEEGNAVYAGDVTNSSVQRFTLNIVDSWLQVTGNAQGGMLFFTVAGVALSVSTTYGQSADQVVQAVVDTINSNTILSAMGVSAFSIDSTLYTNGSLTYISTSDAGILLSQGVGSPPAPDGDINLDGVINVVDVLYGQRVLAGTESLTSLQLVHSDIAPLVGGIPAPDGLFTPGDLLVIQRKVLGQINF